MSISTMTAKQKGLTLVETLVALAILAMVTMSALALLSQSTRFAANEQDRLLAGIVADNLLVTALAQTSPPATGEEVNTVEMGGQIWEYTRTTLDTGGQGRLITFTVRRENGEQTLANASTVKEVK